MSAPGPADGDALDANVDAAVLEHVFDGSLPALWRFHTMLAEQGEARGVIGPRERERLWSRHLVNSAAAAGLLPRAGRVADVGSGAGFPGVVLAAMRPDLSFDLVDSMERRCSWLQDAVREMGLRNVRVVHARAEALGSGPYDAVTARAVARLAKLVRLVSDLLAPGSRLLALKGRRAADEVDDARPALRRARLRARVEVVASPLGGQPAHVVVCERS